MIVYEKLMNILSERKINKRQLSEAIGIKANTMSALSKNRNVNMETINRICEYLQVQPSEIMEWIPDAEYEKANAEIYEMLPLGMSIKVFVRKGGGEYYV